MPLQLFQLFYHLNLHIYEKQENEQIKSYILSQNKDTSSLDFIFHAYKRYGKVLHSLEL